MKKALLIMLCVLISISFSACSNNSNSEDHDAVSENLSVQDTDISKKDNADKTKNDNNQNEKSISKLYISYSGINMDITNDENRIAELLKLEKDATVPETKLSTKFADITAVYSDNTEEIYGTIYIGEDNGYYLEFANSTIEGAACKISDSSFGSGLF